jgi:hypothetical protein
MKKIKNDSVQSFELHLNTPKGLEILFLTPKKVIVVPDGYISSQILILQKRRHITITNC